MTDILSIGTSATLLYQKSLATVSNNVANLNSEGYSRQEAINVQNYPTQYGVHYLGSGAYLGNVKRNYDEFVERNLRTSLTEMSTHKSMANYTARLLDTISTDKTALSPAFDRFFSVAEALGLQPNSLPLRADLFSSAQFLAGRFQGLAQQLVAIDQESADDMQAKIQEVNSLSSQLADVNRQLLKHSSVLKQPATLLDQRDRLLKALSGLIELEVTQLTNGQVDVRARGAGSDSFLILGDKSFQLSVDFDASPVGSQALVLDKYGANRALPNLTGGEISGVVTFRRDVLAPLMTQLNILAASFVSDVNAINRNGLTLDNQAGTDVFSIARNFKVTNSTGQLLEGVRITETQSQQQEYNLSLSWLGGNQWQMTDNATNSSRTITGTVDDASLSVNIAGLSIAFSNLPLRGDSLTIRSNRLAAQGMTMALADARDFAFAEKYYVNQSATNQQPLEARLLADTSVNTKLNDVLSLDTLVGKNVPITIASGDNKPALLVPAGMSEFVVSFQPPVNSDAELQLYTTAFNHLLGNNKPDTQTQDAMRKAAFDPSSVYLDSNLAEPATATFSYRGTEFFYGHRAQNFVQSSGIVALTQAANAASGTSSPLIAAGSLRLNGTDLPALDIGAENPLTAQRIAEWINIANTGPQATGVEAHVVTVPRTDSLGNVAVDTVTGEPLEQQVLRFSGASIEFSFAENGKPRHLSILGLSTGLYGNGAAAESLLVYATGSPEASTLQISVPTQTKPSDVPQLNKALRITFSKPEGQALQYQIRDQQGISISTQIFNAANGVKLSGLILKFDQLPGDGDEFIVDVNANASGDNRNLLSLIEMRNAKVVNQQSLKDYYLGMVNTVGNVQKIASMNLETSQIIFEHANNKRSMVSGVNLDQEAADLIRFQQAYQAAAQVIQTSIKLFDTLLSSSR
jgi:flagellar hook-associated protein FlgK